MPKHVVLTGNADDSLDWTDGWQGSIQYLVIDQASDSGDNGIEADNREGNEARNAPFAAEDRQHDAHWQKPANAPSDCAAAPPRTSTTR